MQDSLKELISLTQSNMRNPVYQILHLNFGHLKKDWRSHIIVSCEEVTDKVNLNRKHIFKHVQMFNIKANHSQTAAFIMLTEEKQHLHLTFNVRIKLQQTKGNDQTTEPRAASAGFESRRTPLEDWTNINEAQLLNKKKIT